MENSNSSDLEKTLREIIEKDMPIILKLRSLRPVKSVEAKKEVVDFELEERKGCFSIFLFLQTITPIYGTAYFYDGNLDLKITTDPAYKVYVGSIVKAAKEKYGPGTRIEVEKTIF